VRRKIIICVISSAILSACHSGSAWAVITFEFPLQKVIDEHAHYIFVAKVERLDPERPAMVLSVQEQLKGKAPFERMPVNLAGDKKDTPKLLKRIAPDLELMLFVNKADNGQLMALAFTNGTWIQLLGYPDGKEYRWAFTHGEIYLRRTFRGATQELKTVVTEVLAKKKRAPPYDPKVPPGWGKELEQTPKQTP
jgi:hypothetical protein